MPPSDQKNALIDILHKTNAALGTFMRIDGDLRSIKKGMPADATRTKLSGMIRTNEEIFDAMQLRLTHTKRQLKLLDQNSN